MWKCFKNCHRTQACGNLFNMIRRPGLSCPLCQLQQQSLLNPHSEVSVRHPPHTHTHTYSRPQSVSADQGCLVSSSQVSREGAYARR